MILPFLLTIAASACHASDGDTVNCRGQRYRLLGIDAPELHGCPKGRRCAPGNGVASKRSLSAMLKGPVRLVPVKRDRYGRVVAQVYAGGRNLACAQVMRGHAVYVAKWDDGRRLARECWAVSR